MAGAGLPFQIAAEGRYDRSGARRALRPALAGGKTVYLPQVHQVLPRLMRLIVALRVALFGPFREEASFLFLVEGTGRPGMGLHHDGDVDAMWLQLEGRRRVTLGPPVAPGAPEDLGERAGRAVGWRTLDLEPGSLFHVPARTPHAVVCPRRSLAVTLTWRRRAARARPADPRRAAASLARWDVADGFAEPIPPAVPALVWTQLPVIPVPAGRGAPRLWTPDGPAPALPASARRWARRLALMPRLPRALARAAGLGPLIDAGLLAAHDLPRRIRPDRPATLDGWRFA
jgi:hypothetical protein